MKMIKNLLAFAGMGAIGFSVSDVIFPGVDYLMMRCAFLIILLLMIYFVASQRFFPFKRFMMCWYLGSVFVGTAGILLTSKFLFPIRLFSILWLSFGITILGRDIFFPYD